MYLSIKCFLLHSLKSNRFLSSLPLLATSRILILFFALYSLGFLFPFQWSLILISYFSSCMSLFMCICSHLFHSLLIHLRPFPVYWSCFPSLSLLSLPTCFRYLLFDIYIVLVVDVADHYNVISLDVEHLTLTDIHLLQYLIQLIFTDLSDVMVVVIWVIATLQHLSLHVHTLFRYMSHRPLWFHIRFLLSPASHLCLLRWNLLSLHILCNFIFTPYGWILSDTEKSFGRGNIGCIHVFMFHSRYLLGYLIEIWFLTVILLQTLSQMCKQHAVSEDVW